MMGMMVGRQLSCRRDWLGRRIRSGRVKLLAVDYVIVDILIIFVINVCFCCKIKNCKYNSINFRKEELFH